MSKWSHLPNAVHIDRVLASLNTRPDQWAARRIAISDKVWNEVWNEAWEADWRVVWEAAWETGFEGRRDNVWYAARDVVSGVLLCLIAYDDCAHILDSDVGELKILAALGDHRAILLLPACIAFHTIKELENANRH